MNETDFNNVLRLESDGDGGVERVRGKLIFVYKRRSKDMKKDNMYTSLCLWRALHAHLLTGSLMAMRKSCAWSAMGENASRMIWPSSGLIHIGREAWSALRWSHEKSWSWNMCDTRLSCCLRCIDHASSLSAEESLPLPFPTSLRVRALKLILADFGTREGCLVWPSS